MSVKYKRLNFVPPNQSKLNIVYGVCLIRVTVKKKKTFATKRNIIKIVVRMILSVYSIRTQCRMS